MSPISSTLAGASARGYGGLSGSTTVLGDFQSIESYTVAGSSTSTITFSTIPQTFTHLQIRGALRATSGYYESARMLFNGSVGGTDYNCLVLRNNGVTAESTNYISNGLSNIECGYIAGSSTAVGTYSPFIFDFYDYTDTSKNRNGKGIMGYENNGVGPTNYDKGMTTVDYWNRQLTTAISQISILVSSSYFAAGSTLALYGIKG